MKMQILNLIVLLLFAAIGGFAAQAQDNEETPSEWFVNYQIIEESSRCNATEFWIGHELERNLPDDGHIYRADYLNGVFLGDYYGAVSAYYSASGWFVGNGAGVVPYTFRKIITYISDSGAMPTIGFAFNLYCNEFNNPTVSMEILPF